MRDRVKDMRRQQNDKLMLAIIESAQDAILMMDPEGRVSYWNPAAERIFDYTKDETIGQNLHDLIAPARFHSAHQTAVRVFRQTGQGSAIGKTLELDARRKGGQEFPVQLSLSAVQMDDGWHAVGLIRDITERKQAEEKLHEKERLLSESQRLGHIGSFLYDMTGKLSWSDELYRIYGLSPDTFTPTVESFLSLMHPDDRPAMQAWMAASETEEKTDSPDFRINRPDGTIRFVRGYSDVVHDSENRPIYVAGMVQDITKRKRVEEKLQRYSAELEKKNNELQDALANVKQLAGMLPICASCKQIRDDKGYWKSVESYISEHSEAVFSHGLCPVCEKELYVDLDTLVNKNARKV